MEFSGMFIEVMWPYLVMALLIVGLIVLWRDLARERRWRKEDAATCRLDIKSWQDKFDDEHVARIEFASLNTELTLQRDGLAKSLLVFGDVYRELEKANLNMANVQGCICEMTGDGIKPLTDIRFVDLGHYQIAGMLTKFLLKNSA